jgi:hypothetical protein
MEEGFRMLNTADRRAVTESNASFILSNTEGAEAPA